MVKMCDYAKNCLEWGVWVSLCVCVCHLYVSYIDLGVYVHGFVCLLLRVERDSQSLYLKKFCSYTSPISQSISYY